MARPRIPRLALLEPADVADEVCRATLTRLRVLADALHPAVAVGQLSAPSASALGRAVADLVRYAQGRHDDPSAMDEILAWLDTTVEATSIETSLGLALAAASGRLKLDRGEPVTLRELACLGGVDKSGLHRATRAGEVQSRWVDRQVEGKLRSVQVVDADHARAWLTGRWPV